MKIMKNTRISTTGWAFVIALTAAGGLFAASSLITFNNISSVKKIWDSFEESRSEKAGALSALRKEIGYGGMIHQFKNFVLRNDQDTIGIVNAKLGGAASAIARYQALGLNKDEKKAIDDIHDMLGSYRGALSRAAELAQSGISPRDIDIQVRVDDSDAIRGLDTLDAEVVKISGGETSQLSKSQAVGALRKAMGYGGMIHNFKNMVLRHDHQIFELTLKNITTAKSAIDLYAKRTLNTAERRAIIDISGVVTAYSAALSNIEELSEQNIASAAIDGIVRIDDNPALRGFNTLTREIAKQNEAEAEKVNTALDLVTTVAQNAALVTLAIIVFLVISALTLVRSRIVGPIERITEIMSRLAAGDLDLKVDAVDQNNEIGEMARAVEVFRNTAIEREKADLALKESGERLGAVVNHIFDGVIIIDETGSIQSVNQAAKNIFRYEESEIIDQNVRILMPEPYHSAHDGYLSNYLSTGKSGIIGVGRDVDGMRKDGTSFPINLQIADLNLSAGRFFLGVVRDLTEQKEADRAKGEFVSTVSHELRTPLTSIKGSLGLIRSGAIGELPDKLRAMLDIAYNNSDRLVVLINDILDMEKIKAGKMDYHMDPVNVDLLVNEAIEANQGYGDEHGVTFINQSQENNVQVLGDKNRLIQVLSNLMSNAAKFSPVGEQVVLNISRANSSVRVSVSDKGPGIPEEFKKSIFQKFSQADSSDTRKKGGTGLGLSITKAIVEQHGGSIGFESENGTGSTFFFNLPEMVELAKGSGALQPTEDGEDRPRILHVEDDDSVLQVVSALVADMADIVYARSFADAKKLIGSESYDLIILDLILPDGDGEALLPLLNEQGLSSIPVIIFSAKDVSREMTNQINSVLVKSQTTNEVLLDTIRATLEAGRTEESR